MQFVSCQCVAFLRRGRRSLVPLLYGRDWLPYVQGRVEGAGRLGGKRSGDVRNLPQSHYWWIGHLVEVLEGRHCGSGEVRIADGYGWLCLCGRGL